MKRVVAQIHKQVAESCKVNAVIAVSLKELGYGG